MKFTYEYFKFFFCSRVIAVNVVLQTTPEEKITRIRSGEHAGQIPLLIILSPKTLDKACIDICAVWAVAESC